MKKHKPILVDLESKELIARSEKTLGKRIITMYESTQKGIEFCQSILEPYEKMFPRSTNIDGYNVQKYNSRPPLIISI